MSQEEEQLFEELLDNDSIYADTIEGALNLCAEKNITNRDELIAFLNQIKGTRPENLEIKNIKKGYQKKENRKISTYYRYVIGVAASVLLIISLWIIVDPGQSPLDSMVSELHKNEPEPFGMKLTRGVNPNNSSFNQAMIIAIQNLDEQKFTLALTTFKEYCSSSEEMEKEFACFYEAYIYYKTEDWEVAEISLNNFIQTFSESQYSNDLKAEFYLGRLYFELSNNSESPKDMAYLEKSLNSYKKVKDSDLLIGRQITDKMLEAINTRILKLNE